MTGIVEAGDWDECAEEPGMYGCGRRAACVEMEGEEADGDVKGFAGNFVPVDEGAPVSVDGDEAEGRGGAGDGAPVGGVRRGGGGGGEVAVGLGSRAVWWLLRGLRGFGRCDFFLSFGVGFGTPAAGSGTLIEAGV